MNFLPRLGAISISYHHIKDLNKKIEKRTNKSKQNQMNLKKHNKRPTLATPYTKDTSNQHTTTQHIFISNNSPFCSKPSSKYRERERE